MGFVSRHARTGGEEKKGGGKKFRSIRLYSLNSLNSLTYHMHSRKIEEHKTSVCFIIRAVCYSITDYYLLRTKSSRAENQQNFPSHSSKSSHEQREYLT